MIQDANIRMVDFSLLQDGDKFFMSRPEAVGGARPNTKIATVKNARGVWTNTKSFSGIAAFIPYDSRVWVIK